MPSSPRPQLRAAAPIPAPSHDTASRAVSTARAATLAARSSDVAIVARVLAGGDVDAKHVEAASRVVAGVGSLRAIARAGRERLLVRGELTAHDADTLLGAIAFERAVRESRAACVHQPRLRSAESIGHWAVPRLGDLEHEEVWVLVLGARHHLIAARRVFQGGVHAVPIHLPSLLREVVSEGGARFALVHNHPSGDPSPSREDILVTERVAKAAATLGVVLVDHVIVTVRAWACVPFQAALV